MVSKKIYDSLHGFIHLDPLETELIHTKVFQRLHQIHQLGIAYLVYPGGTHKRFEHSLGVMELSSKIYDHLILSTYEISTDDAFRQLLSDHVPKIMSIEYEYYRKVVRLAALCHDLGHLPFSHSAEHELLGEGGHERWTCKIICSEHLRPFWKALSDRYGDGRSVDEVQHDVMKIAVGGYKLKELGYSCTFTPWESIVSEIITGDFFGADRIDYLLRDAKYTGIAYGQFDYQQLIERLKILPSTLPEGNIHLKLGIEEEGIESCEALLMARYFMHKRICHYATVKAYTWHLRRFMKFTFENHPFLKDLDQYLDMSENEIFVEIKKAEKDPCHPGHQDAISLLNYDKRCKAIALPSNYSEGSVKELLDKLQIEDAKIFTDINPSLKEYEIGLDFPVLRKDGSIVSSSLLSKIKIPIASSNWVYVPSHFEMTIRQSLGF